MSIRPLVDTRPQVYIRPQEDIGMYVHIRLQVDPTSPDEHQANWWISGGMRGHLGPRWIPRTQLHIWPSRPQVNIKLQVDIMAQVNFRPQLNIRS